MNKSVFPGKYGLASSAARAALLLLALLLLTATAQSAGGRAAMNDEDLSASPLPQSVDNPFADEVPAGWSQDRVEAAVRSSPVMFIENVGQFDDRARLQVRGDTGTVRLAAIPGNDSITHRSSLRYSHADVARFQRRL